MEAQQSQKIVFLNQGLMSVRDSLFIQGDFYAVDNSEICQTGKTVLTGDFHNNVTAGNVFTANASLNKGRFEFRGSAAQQITGTASKERVINFPDVLCINTAGTSTAVTMQPHIAATTKRLDMQNGRLILESQTQGDAASVNAHLLIEEGVTGNHPNNVQVNLALGEHYKNRRLVGFASPFETLYADYFFFNFLSRPTAKGLFGNDGRLITNPRTALRRGLGYIVGMGIIPEGDPYYTKELDPRWAADAKFGDRATTKFTFQRETIAASFKKFLTEQNAPGCITGEKLVTGDVTGIALEQGFNYLGNPYMTPLDLTDIIEGATSVDWGVADGGLKKGFYVLSQGTGEYKNAKFTFNASYLLSQKVGSTTNGTTSVAPMQMFIVGADKSATIKIPAQKRKHDTKATFLRSAPGAPGTPSDGPVDELLIETRDEHTEGYDRLCIVFRNGATLSGNDQYDAQKIFNRSGGVNQIYTRSAEKQDMTVSVVPPTTEKMTVYFQPSSTPQQVVLSAGRISSLVSVGYVMLEDTKTGVTTDLMRTPSYTFTSSPADNIERFVIHFTFRSATATGDIKTVNPSALYEGGTLRIYGLSQSAPGSDIRIYNTNGQLLHRQTLDQPASPVTINKYLTKGVYMVRNNNTVIKFAVKD
jgi:hypothetical protein